eukprot:scaffold14563_cov242-Isochrysis_galbana.AAC.2
MRLADPSSGPAEVQPSADSRMSPKPRPTASSLCDSIRSATSAMPAAKSANESFRWPAAKLEGRVPVAPPPLPEAAKRASRDGRRSSASQQTTSVVMGSWLTKQGGSHLYATRERTASASGSPRMLGENKCGSSLRANCCRT